MHMPSSLQIRFHIPMEDIESAKGAGCKGSAIVLVYFSLPPPKPDSCFSKKLSGEFFQRNCYMGDFLESIILYGSHRTVSKTFRII